MRHLLLLLMLGALLAAQGCASRPVPADKKLCAQTSNVPRADQQEVAERAKKLFLHYPDGINILALSGGGRNGAWGAGVLNGMRDSKTQKRPDTFHIVTGISTGALLSTHAFLGTLEDDKKIRDAFTTVDNDDIFDKRSTLCALLSTGLVDHQPLRDLMETTLPKSDIDRVACAGDNRLFYVGTIDMDCGELVIWDMIEIAKSGDYALYWDVLVASASVPGFASPWYVNGNMHLDGGTREQILMRSIFVPICEELHKQKHAPADAPHCESPHVFAIVNGYLGVQFKETDSWIVDIAVRAIEILTDEAIIGNLRQLQWLSQQSGAHIHLCNIPDCFREITGSNEFDPVVMCRLYKRGFDWARGVDGAKWLDKVPETRTQGPRWTRGTNNN